MVSNSRPIAILIDGDNAQPSLIEHVLVETAKYGIVTTRRIYGDWTTPQMSSWKESLHSYAVQPMQQFRYTVGKNATDSAMIIDAMDLLHSGTVEGFCIVSSDSDYTRLATRIREQGLFVMGIGRSDTPKAFVNACEIFVYTENLFPQPDYERPSDENWARRTGLTRFLVLSRWPCRTMDGRFLALSETTYANWILRLTPEAMATSNCHNWSDPVPRSST